MSLWKPEAFHGKNKKKTFFEGCYYKLVSNDENYSYAFIPGISFGKDESSSHSFIQVYNGKDKIYIYNKFKTSDFWYSTDGLEIKIGNNYFSKNKIHLEIDNADNKINGDLTLSNIHSWPVKFISPSAMGWFEFVPFMECLYHILCFNNKIDGTLNINGKNVDFSGGKGYIEKNWGRSFPESWIWSQSNHFEEYDASIVLSVANVPWVFRSFPGFVIGFWLNGSLYRFCTYTGAKITKLRIDENEFANKVVSLSVINRYYGLDIKATMIEGMDLLAPVSDGMTGRCNESLKSYIDLTFYKRTKEGDQIIFAGKGRNAGLEINGNIDKLIANLKLK